MMYLIISIENLFGKILFWLIKIRFYFDWLRFLLIVNLLNLINIVSRINIMIFLIYYKGRSMVGIC